MKTFLRFAVFLRLLTVLFLLGCLAPAAPARTALADSTGPEKKFRLVKDLNIANSDSYPEYFFGLGDRFVFSTNGDGESRVLSFWGSDGTAEGTIKLIDGAASGTIIGYKGKGYFMARSGDSAGLWVTDGTLAGTNLIYEFPQAYFYEHSVVVYDGWLYFLYSYYDRPNYRMYYSIWRTDGTTQNTTLVSDETQFDGMSPYEITALNNALYYKGSDSQYGSELWRLPLDGGPAELLVDLCPNMCGLFTAGSSPRLLTIAGNQLFFVANDAAHGEELWVSDGTAGGTHLVMDIRDGIEGTAPKFLTPVGDWLYFTADDGIHGRQFWRTDGTQAHTSRIEGLSYFTAFSTPFAVMNSDVYIAAEDGAHGPELWKVTGPQAAAQVIDILPGAEGSIPENLTVAGQGPANLLYFTAQNQVGNRELWCSGGTEATTWMVKDIVPGKDGSWPDKLAAWNNRVIFAATDLTHNREAWVSDGSVTGTYLLADLSTGISTGGSQPQSFKKYGGLTYFGAYDGVHGRELWRTDGTAAGTINLGDFAPGPLSGIWTMNMDELNGIVYFAAPDNVYGYTEERAGQNGYGSELWRTDGTLQGTWLVKDIRPGLAGSYPHGITRAGNSIFFMANDGAHGWALWKSDGTADGTVLVKEGIPGDFQDLYDFFESGGLGSTLIFSVNFKDENQVSHGQLWRSDGTAAGTVPFYDRGGLLAAPDPFDGKLIWKGSLGSGQPGFFVTDGTNTGTQPVLMPGAPTVYYETGEAAKFADKLAFTISSYLEAGAPPTGSLWKLAPGTLTAEHIQDFPQATLDLLTSFGETALIFRVTTETTSRWWISDGTAQGTRELCPACQYTAGGNLTVQDGQFYFESESDSGMELWTSDGTPEGTHSLFADDPNLALAKLGQMAPYQNGILFAADDGVHGQELWAFRSDYLIYLPVTQK